MLKLNYFFILILVSVGCINIGVAQNSNLDINLFTHQAHHQINHNKDASGVALNPLNNELQVVFNKLPNGNVTTCAGQSSPKVAGSIGSNFSPQCFTPYSGLNLAGNTDIEGITHISGNIFGLLSEASGKIYFGTLSGSNVFTMTDDIQLQYVNAQGNTVDLSAFNTTEDGDTGDGLEGITYDPVTSKIFVVLENQCGNAACQTYLYSFDYNPTLSYNGGNITVDVEFVGNLGLGDASGLFHIRNGNSFTDNHILILSHKSYKLVEFDLASNTIISELDLLNFLSPSQIPQAEGVVYANNNIYIVSEGSGNISHYHIFKSNCIDELSISNTTSSTYEASNKIQSDALIPSSQVVDFNAGHEIVLQPNFEVKAGADFMATIAPCTVPNFQTNHATFRSDSSEEKVSSQPYKIYPNPSTGSFTIEFNSEKDTKGTIQLFTINGKSVYEKKVNAMAGKQQILIESANPFPGLYLLKMSTNNETSVHKIVIK